MKKELYTPGHSRNTIDFMSRRSLESHGEFFIPYLTPGISVLDCGCGPGTMTLDIARRVAPGKVVGVDFAPSQTERALANVRRAADANVEFKTADCYSLPFRDDLFDRVFSHALMEHLSDPVGALKVLARVLKPGGIIGVCSPDWGGLLIAPLSPELAEAVETYAMVQSRNGGNLRVGRHLGEHLEAAGFEAMRMSARYECYPDLGLIGDYLALQLEREGEQRAAAVIRDWSRSEAGMFAQAWVSAIGAKPAEPHSR